jgi:hypothetical protein
MSQLYDVGYSRGEAAKLVASELARLGHKATAGAVADWRDECALTPGLTCSTRILVITSSRGTSAPSREPCGAVCGYIWG